MENQYFNEALQNFVRDFAYGGAIRHLVDLGYDTDRIIREYHYPLPRDVIEKMVTGTQQAVDNSVHRLHPHILFHVLSYFFSSLNRLMKCPIFSIAIFRLSNEYA